MIIWNVFILIYNNKKDTLGHWKKIGEHRFDYYGGKACKQDIEENRPDLMKQINKHDKRRREVWLGHAWEVVVKEWT
jgi:hypothetical protein